MYILRGHTESGDDIPIVIWLTKPTAMQVREKLQELMGDEIDHVTAFVHEQTGVIADVDLVLEKISDIICREDGVMEMLMASPDQLKKIRAEKIAGMIMTEVLT